MLRFLPSLVALTALALVLAACGDDGSEPPADAPPADGGGDPAPDAGASGAVRLHGVVSRSVTPTADGDGDIYIAIFDRDPVLAMADAVAVGNAFLADADLSADGATVPYSVEDLPVRAEPYFVIAFMDDNGNVDPSDPESAGPDSGDLLSLRGLASLSVTLAEPGDRELDIDLNSVLP